MTNSNGFGGSAPVQQRKQAARLAARTARAGLSPALGQDLAAHVLDARLIPHGSVVSGFWPLPGEIDVRPLLEALRRQSCRILLPRTPKIGHPLTFHAWEEGEPLSPGPMGTWQPNGAEDSPEVLLVPLLAFDRSGARLGYGGGYYDRTLAALPGALAIGCAFSVQEMESVPAEQHDVRLSVIATERGIIRVGRS